jgi:phenylacetate-coenzyme A ligase PaaK-like adenylate-forming protein
MLVNTDIVVDELMALDGISAFQIVFTREPRSDAMDQLVIRIERSENGKADDATIREIVTRRLREAISLRPEVEFVSRGQLYDHERSIKSKRVLDLRKQPE